MSVTGVITGLAPGAVLGLQDQAGQATLLSANGSFAVVAASSAVTDGSFRLSIQGQPAHQACQFQGGTPGTVTSRTSALAIVCVGTPLEVLYVSDTTNNRVVQFSISEDGSLVPLGATDPAAQPWQIAIHPSGRFAYAANFGTDAITQYAIAGDGSLSRLDPPTVATGSGPQVIRIHPAGRHAYVSNARDGNVTQYAVDAATGQLRKVADLATNQQPCDIAFHPDGRGMYVSNSAILGAALSSVTGFNLDAEGSALAPGHYNGTYGGACAMAISRAGVLYVTHKDGTTSNAAYVLVLEQYPAGGDRLGYLAAPVRMTANVNAVVLDAQEAHLDVLQYDTLLRYDISADGSLGPAPVALPLPDGCIGVSATRDSANRLYVGCGGTQGTLLVFEELAGSLQLTRKLSLPRTGQDYYPPQPFALRTARLR